MSDSKSKKLDSAEKLIDENKFEQALHILDNLEKRAESQLNDKFKGKILRIKLLNKLGQYEDSLEHAEQLLQEHQISKMPLYNFDALFQMGESLIRLGKLDNVCEVIDKAEKMLKNLILEQLTEVRQREAELLNQKGTFYWYKGDLRQSLEYYQQSLALRRRLGNKIGIASSLNNIGLVYWQKGELKRGLEYLQRALTFNEEIGDKQSIARSLINIGVIYTQTGELNQALYYYKQSLTLFEEIGNKDQITAALNNIGMIYQYKGDFDQALDYYQRSLTFFRELGNKTMVANLLTNIGAIYQYKNELDQALDYYKRSLILNNEINNNFYTSETLFKLITVTSEKSSGEEAQMYLQQLQAIVEKEQNKSINLKYRLAQAIIFKNAEQKSGTLSFSALHSLLAKLVTSQRMLRQITIEEVIDHDLTVQAIYNLCELLILELKTLGNEAALNEVDQLSRQLLQIGQKQHSYSLLVKTYWIMAKLALLKSDIKQTQDLLTQAHQIAEEKGYDRLAQIIANERKRIDGQIPTWHAEENISLLERLSQARLEGLIISLRQNCVETSSEDNILTKTPSLDELKTFAEELNARRVKW